MANAAAVRPVTKVIKGRYAMEGAGVKICRTIGVGDVRVDPFLMLDELRLPSREAFAGFPDHPHRGFSTCSIMLSGRMEHRDSAGNHGVIGPGGVQWMTAGRGIVHSEMPVVTDGDLHGFQLWVNLPAAQKMSKPWYQDIGADAIPVVAPGGQAGASVRVMAGASGGATGPIKLRNGGLLLDVRLAAGAEWGQEVPPQWNAFAYVYEGGGKLGGHAVDIRHAYVLGNEGTRVQAEAGGGGLRFLLAAGQPINEPIVQHGPFVMNTAAEIQQAFADYRNGQLQNPGDDVWKDEEL